MRSSTPQFDSDEELNLIDPQPCISELPALPKEHSAMDQDYSSLAPPERCVADFCLVPIGTPTASVSNEVATVQRLMKASGLEYSMHSAGTTVEGSWNDVMELIGKAHSLIHENGIARVQTDIRAGSRTDKIQHFSEKVSKVESILSNSNTNSLPNNNISTPASTSIHTPTSIPTPATTAQIISYSTRGPWISASMHLRRSFMPPHFRDDNSSDSDGALTSQQVSSSGLVAGSHTTSLEFRTGFENVTPRHIAYFFIGLITLKILFAPVGFQVVREVSGPGYKPKVGDLSVVKGKGWW